MRDLAGSPTEWKPGKVTVVSFCAYWCDTWKQEIPRLEAAKNATNGLPVDFITVSVDGRWVEKSQNSRSLPLWLDDGGEWCRAHAVDRVPTTVVLDKTGEIRYVSGAVNRSQDVLDAVHQAMEPKANSGVIYLTFDDFPSPGGSDDLLDALRATNVKATLFCIGSRIEPQNRLLRRARDEGMSLQCHSWDHDAAYPQLERCREAFQRVLGLEPQLYRAPGHETIVGAPRHPVIDPFDYQRPAKTELLRRVLSSVRDGAVIQFHAGVTVTLEALPDIVANLRKRGFQFGTL